MNREIFLRWDYGGAIIMDALYNIDEAFHTNYTPVLDEMLNQQLSDVTSIGYKLLHGLPLPTDKAVGDIVGLFPITYLNRLLQRTETNMTPQRINTTAWWTVVNRTVDFILTWPHTLKDGTFSRDEHGSWSNQTDQNASFVWADDQFMGLALLSRYSVIADVTRQEQLLQFVCKQLQLFNEHLSLNETGLTTHGYNDASGHQSCCSWGRGQGWGLMALVEGLSALDRADPKVGVTFEKERNFLLNVFQRRIASIMKYQNQNTGFWKQV